MERVRRAEPFESFIPRHGHKKARVKQWQTGITQARQRVILGLAWVYNRRTISGGLDMRG